MKRTESQITVVTYASSVHPEIETMSEGYADTIEWADAHPIVWRIVLETKSAAWGRTSSRYPGHGRGEEASAVLYRATVFREYYEHGGVPANRGTILQPPYNFFQWSARFTFDHYKDKGFHCGFFQQFDGTYPRGCASLDYTPETKEEVLDRFLEWCKSSYDHGTKELWIDKKVVRTFAPDSPEAMRADELREVYGLKGKGDVP